MDGQTKYSRIRQGIVNLIATEQIQPGERLPAERCLAKRFDTSVLTVRQALQRLGEMGIVRREHGRGTFLSADLTALPTTGVVALLLVGKGDSPGGFHAQEQQRLFRALASRGCEPRVLTVGPKPGHESMHMLQGVVGVIATGWLSQSWMALLNSLTVPVVIVGDTLTDQPSPPVVTYDWPKLVAMMGAHLLDRGATRLGLITAGDGYAPSFPILKGFRDLLESRGLAYDPADVLFAEARENGRDLVALLDAHPELDGLLVEPGFYSLVLAYLLDRPRRPLLGILSAIPPYGQWPASVACSAFIGDIHTQSVELLFEQLQAGKKPVSDRMLPPRLVTQEPPAASLRQPHPRPARQP